MNVFAETKQSFHFLVNGNVIMKILRGEIVGVFVILNEMGAHLVSRNWSNKTLVASFSFRLPTKRRVLFSRYLYVFSRLSLRNTLSTELYFFYRYIDSSLGLLMCTPVSGQVTELKHYDRRRGSWLLLSVVV